MKKLWAAIRRFFGRVFHTLRRPKWRHGGWGALLLTGIVTACVLVSIAAQSLETAYGWRKDFSFNGYATTGEETAKALEPLDKDVELYLLCQSGDADTQLEAILARYAQLSARIRVQLTDIAKNPGILTRFQGDLNSALQADSVVVNCPDTGRYQVLSYDDFVTQGYNAEQGSFEVAGLAYEKILTEAILHVSSDSVPVVGVLQGHGELTMDELSTLTSFLQSNGYDSRAVTLLSGDTLEGIDLLLMAGPQRDLLENELSLIKAFAEDGGSLLALRSFTDPLSLPNYLSLLSSYGITPLSGVVVASEEDAGSYYTERLYLLPTFHELDMTAPLISGSMDVLLLAGASAFETPASTDNALSVATVLSSGPHSYLRSLVGDDTSIERQEGDPVGEFSLALLAGRMHASGNVSRCFAIGNTSLFTDEYFYQIPFTEEFILQLMGELLPQKTVSLDIMAKSAFHPALAVGSRTVGVVLIAALPLLVLLIAVCVLAPRRNR